MSFCSKCGKEIPDGGVCDCQSDNSIYPSPVVENTNSKSAVNKGFIVMGAGLLAVIVVIVLVVSSFSGGYQKPIKNYIKAVNNCDTAKMLSVMVPKNKIKEFKKEAKDSIIDYDAFLDKMDDMLEDSMKELEDDYGKNVKFSAKILDKKKVKGDDLDEIKEDYEDEYDAEVKKAYKMKVEMTIKGKDEKDTEKISLYVVKVKGDGWKLYDYDNEMNFGNAFSTSLF